MHGQKASPARDPSYWLTNYSTLTAVQCGKGPCAWGRYATMNCKCICTNRT